jgi:putative heme-binding domain-containing protein
MKDGRLITGQMMGERGDVLLMADESGATLEVVKDDIEEQTALDVSIMPQDLARQLTRDEFRHLMAYLMDPAAATNHTPENAP